MPRESLRTRADQGWLVEWACQLASSDNCFPWRDPIGRGKGSAARESIFAAARS